MYMTKYRKQIASKRRAGWRHLHAPLPSTIRGRHKLPDGVSVLCEKRPPGPGFSLSLFAVPFAGKPL